MLVVAATLPNAVGRLANERAAGRPQDVADVEIVERQKNRT